DQAGARVLHDIAEESQVVVVLALDATVMAERRGTGLPGPRQELAVPDGDASRHVAGEPDVLVAAGEPTLVGGADLDRLGDVVGLAPGLLAEEPASLDR